MLKPFFAAAMTAPGRHLAFRRLAVAHVLMLAALAAVADRSSQSLTAIGYMVLVLGVVEGAALIGWRLTQLPKSQALEFLLTSPLQPKRLFFAEALVGIGRFALVWLSGLPIFVGLVFAGAITPADLLPLGVMPFVWGVAVGLMLTAWIYEPPAVRLVGELFALLAVLVYLIVGVLAAEKLRSWLQELPEALGQFAFDSVMFVHNMNPFGIVRFWFAPDTVDWVARERFLLLHLAAVALIVGCGVRAAFRLRGHFHDRHYRPIDSGRPSQLDRIGDRPLSWWAVRRVMEYSGRVNLWLAGGFCLLYATYIVAQDHWPDWMGKLVFQLFETWGGAPMVATAMAVMAAVPAVFQYGLWDATVEDRCKRLELLLLSDLTGRDYWHASLSAAWVRGRGYLFAAVVLWLALGISGRAAWIDVVAAAAGGVVLWGLSFAVGFRSFSNGHQTSGLASLMTIGLPLLLAGLLKLKLNETANLVPPGLCYMPLREGVSGWWFANFCVYATIAVWLLRRGVSRCDADLRRWYDANQGTKASAT